MFCCVGANLIIFTKYWSSLRIPHIGALPRIGALCAWTEVPRYAGSLQCNLDYPITSFVSELSKLIFHKRVNYIFGKLIYVYRRVFNSEGHLCIYTASTESTIWLAEYIRCQNLFIILAHMTRYGLYDHRCTGK